MTPRLAPVVAEEFESLMSPLGPFESPPRLALAVSGGADSLSLALLGDRWARSRGGSVLALIVEHGLRPESKAEAATTAARLQERGIPVRILPLTGLRPGPALAERARDARFAALETACSVLGLLHLLLGHQAADQAETVLMRRAAGSGPSGLAGMAAVRETTWVRVLRPLLTIPPGRLRATLLTEGMGWIEDPSNADPRWLRSRLRASMSDRDGIGPAITALLDAARASGAERALSERGAGRLLAERGTLRPEGFALLEPGPVPPEALSALLQMVAGRRYPPSPAAVARLAACPRPATLAGARLLAAGRFGRGMLVVRETAAMAPPVPAVSGALWDGRFRVGDRAEPPRGAAIGALGEDAARLREVSRLPAAVLRTFPAIRCEAKLFAVPHLGYPDAASCARVPVLFSPPRPAACAPFMPDPGGRCAA